MKAHTPGPWIVDDRHVHCERGLTYPSDSPVNRNAMLETDVIVEVDTSCHPDGLLTETDTANLALIAASPDMFAALTRLLDCPDLNLDELEPETRAAIDQANEALTKAKGSQHEQVV